MKRRFVLGIIWSVIAMILTALLIMGLVSRTSGDGDNWGEQHFGEDKMSGITKHEILDGDVGEIEVSLTSLAMELEKGDKAGVEVHYLGGAEKYADAKISGGKLLVNQFASMGFSGLRHPKIVVSVPKKKYNQIAAKLTSGQFKVNEVSAGTMNVEASSGAIDMDEIKADFMSVKTSSGRIKIDDCDTDTLSVRANSGAIKVTDVKCKKLSAETTSGSLKFEGIISQADVKASSGAISFEDDIPLTADSSFMASSGLVNLKLTPSAEYAFETSVTSGLVKNKLKSNRNGSVLIKASTTSGMIKIEDN